MNSKIDPTTKVLLGVIATGVAALTALAFERRYQNGCANARCGLDNEPTDPSTNPPPRQNSLKERIEDRVETLRDKAEAWKDKVSDSFERVADKVKEGLKDGVENLKESAGDAVAKTKQAADAAATEIRKS